MRILVTGGAGFIGSNFVEYVNRVAPDTEIVVLDDLSTGVRENLAGLAAHFVEGSILDRDLMSTVMADVDAVLHLAALGSVPRSVMNPVPSHAANATGTVNVLEAARTRKVGQVVLASSSSVYGSNAKLPKSEYDWTRPMSPYAASKLAAEGYAIAYAHSYGMNNLAFRFFNVFGPRQSADHAYAAVIPRFLDAALGGRVLEVHGDGLQSRDFTYVGTVCATLFDAITRSVSSMHPVNLAFGTRVSLLELIGEIEILLGFSVERRHTDRRQGDVRASQADAELLRTLFPGISAVPLRKGLQETVQWFKSLRREGQ